MAVYDRVRRSRRKLDTVLEALQHKDPSHAAQELVEGETEVEGLRTSTNNRVMAVLRARLGTLRKDVTADLLDRWRSMIYIGLTPRSINIKQQTSGKRTTSIQERSTKTCKAIRSQTWIH